MTLTDLCHPTCVCVSISIVLCCRRLRFHKQISEKSGASVEELSESVQEFYTVSDCIRPICPLVVTFPSLPHSLPTSLPPTFSSSLFRLPPSVPPSHLPFIPLPAASPCPSFPPSLHPSISVHEWSPDNTHTVQRHDRGAAGGHDGWH